MRCSAKRINRGTRWRRRCGKPCGDGRRIGDVELGTAMRKSENRVEKGPAQPIRETPIRWFQAPVPATPERSEQNRPVQTATTQHTPGGVKKDEEKKIQHSELTETSNKPPSTVLSQNQRQQIGLIGRKLTSNRTVHKSSTKSKQYQGRAASN